MRRKGCTKFPPTDFGFRHLIYSMDIPLEAFDLEPRWASRKPNKEDSQGTSIPWLHHHDDEKSSKKLILCRGFRTPKGEPFYQNLRHKLSCASLLWEVFSIGCKVEPGFTLCCRQAPINWFNKNLLFGSIRSNVVLARSVKIAASLQESALPIQPHQRVSFLQQDSMAENLMVMWPWTPKASWLHGTHGVILKREKTIR